MYDCMVYCQWVALNWLFFCFWALSTFERSFWYQETILQKYIFAPADGRYFHISKHICHSTGGFVMMIHSKIKVATSIWNITIRHAQDSQTHFILLCEGTLEDTWARTLRIVTWNRIIDIYRGKPAICVIWRITERPVLQDNERLLAKKTSSVFFSPC